ncbi:MAG: hypothetical protein QOF49_1577 [Chloroflexota bacterium]|jgi:hypothetical protein|nr:hypothetical protein [Chloroflexota bacterium]
MNELVNRIRAMGDALRELRDPLVAGEPWPLSASWGHTPEADWGPHEVLGHISEMLPYWTQQLQAVLAADGATAVPFGRVATDRSRLDRIDADRTKPVGALLDEIDGALDATARWVASLAAADGDRLGRHPTRGEITVRESIERFFVGHVEEHVEQLRRILARSPA